jgi:hypothetical protein
MLQGASGHPSESTAEVSQIEAERYGTGMFPATSFWGIDTPLQHV